MDAKMSSALSSTRNLMQMFDAKMQEFTDDIATVHMVWLEEIQQEANRMFSSDFSAEPELMPKTPSQKKSNRRRRISVGQNESRTKRRFSTGQRSNLRRSSATPTLNLIVEDNGEPPVALEEVVKPPRTRRAKQISQSESSEEAAAPPVRGPRKGAAPSPTLEPELEIIQEENRPEEAVSRREGSGNDSSPPPSFAPSPPPQALSHMAGVMVTISSSERQSAELQAVPSPEPSPGRNATKITIAGGGVTAPAHRRSSVRHSLTVRRSLAGLRHSMTQESVRRASRRSFLKKKARMGSSTCSSNVSGYEDECVEMDGCEEVAVDPNGVLSEEPAETATGRPAPETPPEGNDLEKVQNHPEAQSFEEIRRFTRSMAQSTPTMPPPSSIISKTNASTPDLGSDGTVKKPLSSLGPRLSAKRRAAAEGGEDSLSPRKKPSPPKKSQSMKPNMRSFLHTVQKNQLLMMTPSSLGRTTVLKSFIKHTTPAKLDIRTGSGLVERERLKLETLKKKQEQEEERKKKMEDEKRRKQEEMKRKRDERLRRVVEARVKEEQKEEEKKKKIEQKMAQIDEKNDKLRVERLAEEKAKKKVATKRQEELELRRKMEEDARRKKIQQSEEEEKRQQEILAKRRAEEEQERVRKMAEARRALELKREQEKEVERERQASVERERLEREKAVALQREVERAAREKERKELEEKRKELEEKRKREEIQRQAEEEKRREAERQRQAEEEKRRDAERQREEAKKRERETAAKSHQTADVQPAVMKTPVGKERLLNVTVDVEQQSPQSYEITPKGGNKPSVINTNPEDYGMDQNSDDSTDDESAPRKPIPTWAEGYQLKQSMMKQYFHPLDVDSHYGDIEPPKLERIFCKSKPRYFKRTSSAVWHSPPRMGALPF
ncbi:inner centromere protein A isoform X2 [Esox lucius]|uniref:inner centromere protein A isoform X2 n=1 Tax=Esox lucius TaxID=8010 RepID=UPI000576EEA0|nr:inner centromere protein A isoform X2 [Esox lucius]